jgi:hypothetical protein
MFLALSSRKNKKKGPLLIEMSSMRSGAIKKTLFERVKVGNHQSEKRQKFKYSNHCPFGRGRENSSYLVGFRFLRQLPALRFRPGPLDKSLNSSIQSNKRTC